MYVLTSSPKDNLPVTCTYPSSTSNAPLPPQVVNLILPIESWPSTSPIIKFGFEASLDIILR